MKKYCCDDWDNNIKKVDGPILLQSIRAGCDLYDGPIFRFCPWCGDGIEEQLPPEQIPSLDEMRDILSDKSSNAGIQPSERSEDRLE